MTGQERVRGRNATDPTDIPASGWKDILLRVKSEIASDQVGLIAAGIAFYGLMALFPAMTAMLAVAGLIADPSRIAEKINQFAGLIPAEALDIITAQAAEITGSQHGGLGLAALLSLALSLYAASKGTGSLMQGLNTAYDENETRGSFTFLVAQLALTILIVLGLAMGLAVILAVPAFVAFLDAGILIEMLVSLAAYVLVFALAVAGLAVLYRYGPSRDNPEFRWVSPGALLACSSWVLASAAFAFYVANFGSYNETFGALGGVIVLLTWFWLSAFIVLLGAEFNAEAEAQTRHDTTVGPDQPMGARGAVKADTLGPAQNT